MSDTCANILLLFERPQEPCFMPKGDTKCVFDVPADYLTKKYRTIGDMVKARFCHHKGEQLPKVAVNLLSVPPPALAEIKQLRRDENFSHFIPKHRQIAAKLIDIFLGAKTDDELLSLGVYTRDRVNPYLFNYALSVALLHRPSTRNLQLPCFMHCFPDKFLDANVLNAARETANVVPEGSRIPIPIEKNTATDIEKEHRLFYFREDLGVNLHHWHWHLVYPTTGTKQVVNKDRRGELFYYMHQQIIARYNFERLCNKLKRTDRLVNWEKGIKEAYFPKLDGRVGGRSFPARPANQTFSNIRRLDDQVVFDIADLERWRDRVFEAISKGKVRKSDGRYMDLDEFGGIDILGNLIESTTLSVNNDFYGDLHGMGHVLIASIHDPDQRHLESMGVMGDTVTAMRDPAFYRWHAYIDDLFQRYKVTLPKYKEDKLNYPGITVTEINVESNRGKNILNTMWQEFVVDVSKGLNFQKTGALNVTLTHLQHVDFKYNITVNNTSGSNKEGTCRIFLAPKFDERGNPWKFSEQRLMFIELDKFKVNLEPGSKTIERLSTESSVTIPLERTFNSLKTLPPTKENDLANFNFCGCGWPHHMLIPRGTLVGKTCQLFVMISNYTDDKIDQDLSGVCSDSGSYCGIKDKKYPDRRAMGYPFDRPSREGVSTLEQFLTPNMKVQDITIKFTDQVIKKSEFPNREEGEEQDKDKKKEEEKKEEKKKFGKEGERKEEEKGDELFEILSDESEKEEEREKEEECEKEEDCEKKEEWKKKGVNVLHSSCGPSDSNSRGRPDLGSCGRPDFGICVLPNFNPCGPSDCGPYGPPDFGPCGSPDFGSCGSSDFGICSPPGFDPCGPSDWGPCGPPHFNRYDCNIMN